MGSWVKLPATESVELLAEAGMDLVVIDLEHSPLSIQTASTLATVALGRGIVPFVRVPDHAPSWISRCLDFGARAVVVPHVDTVDQALIARNAAQFEPRGRRGMGPTTRAGSWNLRGPQQYIDGAREVAVVVQIESAEGLAALPEMLARDAVDGVLLGAADLSMSLGVAMDDPSVSQHMLEVLSRCMDSGVPCALATGANASLVAAAAEQGYSMVVAGNDASLLGAAARAVVQGSRAT
ncbi:hypothetical protein JXX30_00290 [Rhodococcus erythropolis]|uniref:HpcH/HpaI aldolase family protein n=1 Tax=Rhodococcus erythropolis TaxID=1833 RepID=UPI0019826F17|nr:aldolase/citrate lyase family protein [Rhodococcus erythropolis]QSE41315.1 hypothetical protein JXX30_00290 [Rhodococcus erythropolis]